MTTLSGREYRSISSINSMARLSMDDLIRLMAREAEARREEANQHRLEMAAKAEARREEANQHRLEMEEIEQQQVVELRVLGGIMAALRPRDRARDTPRLPRMMEGEDVESFHNTFERVMRVHKVPEDQWSVVLAPQLVGKAQQAYAGMDGELTVDYLVVKAAILRRYDIAEETHHQKFWYSGVIC